MGGARGDEADLPTRGVQLLGLVEEAAGDVAAADHAEAELGTGSLLALSRG
jgi:hypothetical protein